MPKETSFASLLRALVGPNAISRLWGDALQAAEGDPVGLSHTLLTARGQASGVVIADRVLSLLEAADAIGLERYFAALRDEFEVDLDTVVNAATAARNGGPADLKALQVAAEPPRQELFRRLNAAPGGTGRLVELRRKLLAALRTNPSLQPVDYDMSHLLRSWFNRGFLVPTRIDWHSPADLLEKIISYEAVHAIDTWDALRERLVPSDRRCFGFLHPAMPQEPLIFVEVALTQGISASVQDLLATPRRLLPAKDADTAIFYSISNCQAGLAGISFGAFLIKQVASDLKAELPNLQCFSTLSPVPGFARWAAMRGMPDEVESQRPEALAAAAAVYLVEAKDADGRLLDPVARFHLGNGAQLHQIHIGADTSPKGLTQSHGVMVNYLYELDRIEARHEAFAAGGEAALSRSVRALLGQAESWTRQQAARGNAGPGHPNA